MSGTGTYLDRIVTDVRARLHEPAPASGEAVPEPRSLVASIRAERAAGRLAVIAEVKRRSPSVGTIVDAVDPAERAGAYSAAGAAGISVLTERDHFGGSLDDLVAARAAAGGVPVLRKDFVIDERQLDEARAAGADAVLLIAALFDGTALAHFVDGAHERGMDVLLEVHDERELERALATRATLIGINNRDLRSFAVDLAVTERLAPLVPADRLVVAESGVHRVEDAARLHAAGAAAVLVGEALMRADDPGVLLRGLTGANDRATGASA